MNPTQCPLCFSPLEICDVAPCANCGHAPEELEHLAAGMHTYSEMRIFGDLAVILCDFCQVDFGSYDPEFFGLPLGTPIGSGKMNFVEQVANPCVSKDKYCPRCEYRLAFLEFIAKARELHHATGS